MWDEREYKLSIPTFIFGIIALTLAIVLFYLCRNRIEALSQLIDDTLNFDSLSDAHYNVIFRRLLLLNHIQWMATFDILLASWVILNWGSISVSGSYALQNNKFFCYIIAILFVISCTGTVLFYILILITLIGIMQVKCDKIPLWRHIYPSSIVSKAELERVLRYRRCVAISIIVILCLIPIRNYGTKTNTAHVTTLDKECWVGSGYTLVPYSPIAIAFCLGILTTIYAWHLRGCKRCSRDEPIPIISQRTTATETVLSDRDQLTLMLGNNNDDSTVAIGFGFVWSVTWFVIAFLMAWIWEFSMRIYETVTNNVSPLWVVMVHHFLLAVSPAFNFLVWWQYDPSRIDDVCFKVSKINSVTGAPAGAQSTTDEVSMVKESDNIGTQDMNHSHNDYNSLLQE